jgi:hypothetical protein
MSLAKEAGLDSDLAGRKIAALFTLNRVTDSTKIASAANLDAAVGIRALELLEQAGYTVTWEQPAK